MKQRVIRRSNSFQIQRSLTLIIVRDPREAQLLEAIKVPALSDIRINIKRVRRLRCSSTEALAAVRSLLGAFSSFIDNYKVGARYLLQLRFYGSRSMKQMKQMYETPIDSIRLYSIIYSFDSAR